MRIHTGQKSQFHQKKEIQGLTEKIEYIKAELVKTALSTRENSGLFNKQSAIEGHVNYIRHLENQINKYENAEVKDGYMIEGTF